jgi:multidrug efflux pump subunit AcrA (membrane-fusion protein)
MARGRIEALDVSAGDRVAAGQRLAVLDNFDLSAAHSKVVSTEAGLNQAKAQLATADAAYVRATNLFHGNAVPQKDVETTRAAAASMEAEVRTKEAELRQYQQEEARLFRCIAPLRGRTRPLAKRRSIPAAPLSRHTSLVANGQAQITSGLAAGTQVDSRRR